MIAIVVLVLLALAIGGMVAFVVARDPGYVLIAYDGATVETSVWFALLCALALALGWFALAFVGRRALRAGRGLARRASGRRTSRARAKAHRGAMLLAEGRWREAIDDLLVSTAAGETPLGSFLGAARAANQLGRFAERDDILARAGEALPDAAFVAGLTRAELQQAARQWRESVDTLTALRQRARRHPLVLRRLFDAHRALGDPEAAERLARELPDGAALSYDGCAASATPQAARDDLRLAAWRARLTTRQEGVDAAAHARNTWRAMPKALRSSEALVLDYVDVLAADGAEGEAEAVLRRAIKRHWRAAWVRRYASIGGDARKRRGRATEWLRTHPQDAALLLTLGRLARADGDLAAAREHVAASLTLAAKQETLVEMARLCATNGDHAAAASYFDRALGADAHTPNTAPAIGSDASGAGEARVVATADPSPDCR